MSNTLSDDVWAALHAECKSLTMTQQRMLLDAVVKFDAQTQALCLLLFYSGCRLSEALVLTRDHIDSQRYFVVLHTLKQRSRKLRSIPLPPALITRLVELPTSADGRMFAFSRWTARRRLKPVFEHAGLSGAQATSRSLRHAFQDRAAYNALQTTHRAALLGHTQTINQIHYG